MICFFCVLSCYCCCGLRCVGVGVCVGCGCVVCGRGLCSVCSVCLWCVGCAVGCCVPCVVVLFVLFDVCCDVVFAFDAFVLVAVFGV